MAPSHDAYGWGSTRREPLLEAHRQIQKEIKTLDPKVDIEKKVDLKD
jgi:hypothetical protein